MVQSNAVFVVYIIYESRAELKAGGYIITSYQQYFVALHSRGQTPNAIVTSALPFSHFVDIWPLFN
jgi:hypothetical protein